MGDIDFSHSMEEEIEAQRSSVISLFNKLQKLCGQFGTLGLRSGAGET